MKKYTALILSLLMAVQLAACGKAQAVSISADERESGENSPDFFSERDLDFTYSEESAVEIAFSGTDAAFDSAAVDFSSGELRIKDEGTYILRGCLEGRVTVDAEKTDKIQLVLDGVEINSESSAAIYVRQADKLFLTLAEGSENTVLNVGSFTADDENNIDAVIFSKDDLTLNGCGSLSISSPAGHGIVSKDSLKICGGNYSISAADRGLEAKEDICVAGGSFLINSGKDALQAENAEDESAGFIFIQGGSFEISAGGDGFSAGSRMQIDGGSFDILSGGGSVNAAERSSDRRGLFMPGGDSVGMVRHGGGQFVPDESLAEAWGNPPEPPDGMRPHDIPADFAAPDIFARADDSGESGAEDSSMKGFKAGSELCINGGSFAVDSADDAFHSDGSMSLNGGVFKISSADDAFHAEEKLTVNGGNINVLESYEGMEALHLAIFGGDIKIVSEDDGLNAAGGRDQSGLGGRDGMFGAWMESGSEGSIKIAGGDIDISAYGDGLDANGSIEITGGSTRVCGPGFGDTAIIDYYTAATISGGSFIGSGAAGLSQNFTDSAQGLVYSRLDSIRSAGESVAVLDSSGKTVLSFRPELDFNMVIVSSPELSKEENYTLSIAME